MQSSTRDRRGETESLRATEAASRTEARPLRDCVLPHGSATERQLPGRVGAAGPLRMPAESVEASPAGCVLRAPGSALSGGSCYPGAMVLE